MKKRLLFIFFVSNSILAFQNIDTTTIKNVRYEWEISKNEKDSTLTRILTEYESGIYKLKLPNKDKSKSGDYFIYASEYKDKSETFNLSPLEMKVGNVFEKSYFDSFGNLDSIYSSFMKDSITKNATYRAQKKYKRNNKLAYVIDIDGRKNVYSYGFFGNLRQIKQFKDAVLYKISDYKNNLLVKETFPTKKNHRKQRIYIYDKRKRLVKRDDDDYYFYKYYYAKFGISKIEKIYKKGNFIKEMIAYEYFENGELKGKNVLIKTKVSQDSTEYVYNYKYK